MRFPACELCGLEITPKQSILKEVQGWLRTQGTGGGQIVKRRETGKVAHRKCVEWGAGERLFS